MDRRSFFRCLPASVLALPALLKAEPVVEPETDLWVELDCIRIFYMHDPKTYEVISETPCGTRFKVLRGVTPVCPKCFAQQPIHAEDFRSKFVGIEVKR